MDQGSVFLSSFSKHNEICHRRIATTAVHFLTRCDVYIKFVEDGQALLGGTSDGVL